MKTILKRAYGAWTDNAFRTSNGLWIPKKFTLNWTGDKPPSNVECNLPDWFVNKNKIYL